MESKAYREIKQVYQRLAVLGVDVDMAQAAALRRAALTLHRWYENECNGIIQREGADGEGRPYWHSATSGQRISAAADREKGAQKTIAKICSRLGLYYYLQTDPRGGTLYVSKDSISADGYTRATFVA